MDFKKLQKMLDTTKNPPKHSKLLQDYMGKRKYPKGVMQKVTNPYKSKGTK